MNTTESRSHRIIRRIIATLLIIETAVLSPIACFLLIFIPLMGGMASIYGAGNVSDEQFKRTWWFIGLLTVAPLIVTIALAIASIQILQNKRPLMVIVGCGLFVVATYPRHMRYWMAIGQNLHFRLPYLFWLHSLEYSCKLK